MSHAQEIAKSEDEMIVPLYLRGDGVQYYRLGKSITVSFRGMQFGEDRMYLCHHCVKNTCEHVRRIDRYRQENFA